MLVNLVVEVPAVAGVLDGVVEVPDGVVEGAVEGEAVEISVKRKKNRVLYFLTIYTSKAGITKNIHCLLKVVRRSARARLAM